jgi:hypothetical protein
VTGYVFDDGGRKTARFRGDAGDCVVRAVAIATEQPYAEVYAALSDGQRTQRRTKRSRTKSSSARDGVSVRRKWFKDYMASIGWTWTPTMLIGSGCKVHLVAEELPSGRLVVSVSKHFTAMIDGVIHDTFDPRREVHAINPNHGGPLKPGERRNINGICSIQRRCVYGYWSKP